MSLLRRILHSLGLHQAGERTFTLDDDLLAYVEDLAAAQGLPPEQVLGALLADVVEQREQAAGLLECWRSLSPREQDAAALVCLRHTYRQIAGRMYISSETVKSHLGKVYARFGVTSAGELRTLLSDWDFSEWEK